MKRPGGGLGSVLGKIGKKPKLSTLVWFDTLFSISRVKTYFSQKWSACYRCLRCFSYVVKKAYVMIFRKSQNWTGILSKRKKELRTNSKLATGMGKGFVYMEISNVNFINLLVLTRSSCKKCSYMPSGRNRTCGFRLTTGVLF